MFTELIRAFNSKPNYLYFMVTSRCNASCDFCWNWKNVADAGPFSGPKISTTRKELSLKEIELFTKKLPRMLLVDLYGGEPFLREEIGDIIGLFVVNSRAKYISIPTNGFYTEKTLNVMEQALRKYPKTFFRMCVSIDGFAKTHNKVRKLKDSFENAFETAKGLVKLREKYSNISIAINSNYNADTQDTMEEFIKFLLDYGKFDSINLGLIRGNPFDKKLLSVNVVKYFRIIELIKSRQAKSAKSIRLLQDVIEDRTRSFIKVPLLGEKRRQFKCFAAKKITVVSDEGNVYPCEEMLDNSLGNLRDYNYSLENLLKISKVKKVQKSIKERKCNCRWECAINTSSVFDISAYPKLLFDMFRKHITER